MSASKVFTSIYRRKDEWIGIITGGSNIHEKLLVSVYGNTKKEAEERLEKEMRIGNYERI